jgi:putative redox protein
MSSVTVTSLPEHRYAVQVESDEHAWISDEPPSTGGNDLGPDPIELLLSAMGACTVITLRMYADRKQWRLDGVSVDLTHERLPDEGATRQDQINVDLRFEGDLDADQRARLIEIAGRCPVHRIVTGRPHVILTDRTPA